MKIRKQRKKKIIVLDTINKTVTLSGRCMPFETVIVLFKDLIEEMEKK